MKIIGKWQDESDRFYEHHTYEFFKNGKCLKNSNGHIHIITYKIKEDMLYCEEVENTSFHIVWLNDDKLVIEKYYDTQDLVLMRISSKKE